MLESHPSSRPLAECSVDDCMDRIAAAAPDVHRFVSHRIANAADAADISQQALLLACTKLETFRGGNVPGWLFAIARNQIIDPIGAVEKRVLGMTVQMNERHRR